MRVMIVVFASMMAIVQVSAQDLKIISADYGAETKRVDVTAKIQAAVSGNTVQYEASTGKLTGSDPIFGTVKELRIVYSIGGKQFLSVTREGGNATVPSSSDIQVTDNPIAKQPAQVPAAPSIVSPNPPAPQADGAFGSRAPFAASPVPPAPQAIMPSAAMSGGPTDVSALKPEDWVQGLPAQARDKYVSINASLRGKERIEAVNAWLASWRRYLRDPNLALIELDYIKEVIENRNPEMYEASNKNARDFAAATNRQRLSTLDSLGNMLRAIRQRRITNVEVLRLIGVYTEVLAQEKAQLLAPTRYR